MKSKLQQLREAKGLTRSELSERSGISYWKISSIEREDSSFKTHYGVALALADALECDMNDLFDQNDLSWNGRPPHTGKPITQRKQPSEQYKCIECDIIVPLEVGCDCSQMSVLVPV